MRLTTREIAFALLCLGLVACPEEKSEPDAGEPPSVADTCDSAEAAAAGEACRLALGEERQGHISPLSDVDWYAIDVPEPLPARALLTVTAQYRVPATPVTLVVNLLRADGVSSLGLATDPRPRGAPGPAQVVARLQPPLGPGAGRYFVVVSHDTGADDPAADRKNPYFLTASLTSDPDVNEPNDQTPSTIALGACGTATAQGALSTAGDVDLFSFELQPCQGRTILQLSLTAPASSAGIRASYALEGPDGPVAMDNATNPFTAQKLLTARLVPAGSYTLRVQGYKAPTETRDPPGDPSFIYDLSLALFPDADANEGASGNDSLTNATDAGLSLGGVARTFTGRLSYVGDQDLFEIANPGSRARLHYRLRYSGAPGRFESVPTLQPRDLEVFTATATANDCRANCPNGNGEASGWCARSQCLWQRRVEEATVDFGNFEGQVQLAASGPLYLKVGYQGSEGADDQEYTLVLSLNPDTADEASGPHDRDNAIVVNLPNDGTTTLGHGRGARSPNLAPNELEAIARGPSDYDAVDDTDFFEMRFQPLRPPPPPDGGMPEDAGVLDHTLTLAWLIPPAQGQRTGERSHDLGMRLHFCEDPACERVITTRGFLGYKAGTAQVWYHQANLGIDGGIAPQEAYELDQNAGSFGMREVMCTCIDAKYAAAGKFWVELQAHNRASYDDAQVKLSMSVGPYPPTVTDDEGNTFQCPMPCQWVEKSK